MAQLPCVLPRACAVTTTLLVTSWAGALASQPTWVSARYGF